MQDLSLLLITQYSLDRPVLGSDSCDRCPFISSRQFLDLNVTEGDETSVALHTDITGNRIDTRGASTKLVCVDEPCRGLAVQVDRVGIPADLDLVGVPGIGGEVLVIGVVLLAGILPEVRDLVDGSGVVVEEAVWFVEAGVAARFFVDLNLKSRIDRDERLIVVHVCDVRIVPVGYPPARVAEADEDAGVVIAEASRAWEEEV